MQVERRSSTRIALPAPLDAVLGVTPARVVEISESGARVEHEERVIVFAESVLKFTWRDHKFGIRVKIARSELAGRRNTTLIYQSGVQFDVMSDADRDAIARLVGFALTGEDVHERIAEGETAWTRLEPQQAPAGAASVTPAASVAAVPAKSSGNSFLRDDDDEDPSFIRCELRDGEWVRQFVNSPEHPAEGFTVPIDQRADVDGLMKTYEVADPDTRVMIRAAIR